MFDESASKIMEARLINWGIWNKIRGYPHLGYTSYVQLMKLYFPSCGGMEPDELDAVHIGDILSSLDIGARKGVGWGDIYALVCKLEYIEFERPRESKAEHIRRKFKMPCSERTFRHHLYKAKKALFMFADPL